MTDLALHVGHSKTGTTWLQATLALSRTSLGARGVSYPEHGAARDAASARIERGNAPHLALSGDALRRNLPVAVPGQRAVLYSSEELFPQLCALSEPAVLAAAAEAAGYSSIRILLFIRDPVEHAASLWQQYLKRAGGTAPIEAFFGKYAVPLRVAEFLGRYGAVDGVEVSVRNYSRCRGQLAECMADWLGVPVGDLSVPGVRTLNRSLTEGELAFQRALNRHLGKAGVILSDALCEGMPDRVATMPLPQRQLQDAMWQRLGPAMAEVNALVPEEERYRSDVRNPSAASPPTLDAAQIDVIADALGAEIRRLRLRLASLGVSLGGGA